MATFQFVCGLALLVLGAEALVRGASRIALAARLSPLAIGLTIVAFGTSAPELAVSVKASLGGQAAVAVGNVIGSNTMNVLAILGLASLITPLAVSSQLVRLDIPVMVAVSGLAWLLALDSKISRIEGGMLVLLFVSYTLFLFWAARRTGAVDSKATEGSETPSVSLWGSLALACLGLALLIFGSQLFVGAAIAIATAAGVSEAVIGLTIVAAGTSLPELVTSVVASLRGERDIAVGNVVGSNLFNLLCVLGVAGIVSPAGVAVSPEVLRFDFPVMFAAAAICLPICFTRFSIDRWEGALLLAGYAGYLTFLIANAR